ncbi:MAG: OmpA family protein [Saprospiraceae bacterium]|nr:OmpA family protein [Saprospiraceae bacterium]MBP6566445.1 OmpA family protein [Saprospiraceae bacterium]
MMLRFSYISIAVLYFNVCMIAQPVVSSSYETMLETAATCAENHDYINAIEWFEKAYKESKDPNLQVAIGDMYMLLRDYAKAEKTYDRVLKRDKRDEFFDIRLDYARAMKAQGKYKLALDEFNGFISTTESDSLRNEAKLELRGILLMEKYPENIEAAVSFAGESINSPSAESSPALYSDGTLYFSSMNAKTPTIIDGEEGEYHAKIYSAARTPQGDFSKASALDEAINRIDFYNTGVSFSEDGQKMYFTRAKYNNNGVENSQIYLSKRAGDKWGSPYPIEALNNEFRSRHPYEGELFGRKVLYYISDMPGGYGGYDIYYSTITGDAYEKPVNLGEKINTPRNEMSPFYKDGALYFSSNGHPGMGGLDNFYTEWDGSKWSEVTNMGFNYNTSYDDSFLRFNQGGTAGYVVSNRTHKDKKKYKNTDTCCDDIYMIQIRDLVIELKTIVNNEKGPLEGATVELFEGSKKVPVDSKTNFLSNDFAFLLDSDKSYKAYITREGYYTDSISFNTNGIFDDYTVSKTVTLKAKPEAPKRIVSRNEPILLKSIFFDLADDKIRPDAEPDLEYLKTLMDKYPDMVIELSSHTDSRGDNEYNKKLSQRRANSTKAWLVEEGVEAARIKAVGYGETKLLNKCKDKVKCSEEEHQLNRRSEFKIIAGPQTIEIKMEG